VGNHSEIKKYDEILPLQIDRAMAKQQLLQKGLTPKMEMLTIQQSLIEMQRNRDTAQRISPKQNRRSARSSARRRKRKRSSSATA
jgi:hypothetical protein